MDSFERRAVEITQGRLTLYLTYLTPKDLFGDGFYNVDKFEPETTDGYQRFLDNPRANRLSRHLRESVDEGYAQIPTTVFLASDKSVEYDRATGILRFDKDIVCPFSVVDGQHRIEGLKRALSDDLDSPLWNFELPTSIAVNLDHTHQMYHFYIVNTTQRSVETGLSQQITTRFTDMKGVDELPYLPFWIEREVNRGTDAQALKLCQFLNSEHDSPLKGRIRMANDDSRLRNRINQSSLVTTLKRELFNGTNPITHSEDLNRQLRMMLNYFRAIDAIFANDIDSSDTVVWRYNGLVFFTVISKWVFTAIYASTRDFTVESIKSVISNALDELDEDFVGIANPQWWKRGAGGRASGLNRAAIAYFSNGFLAALNRSQNVGVKI